MKKIKKIIKLLLIWVLAPFGLLLATSCLHHHFGGSEEGLSIQNNKQQPASVAMRLYREYPWYSYLLNPIGRSYHPYYLKEETLVEGSISLEHIHNGDMLRLYVRQDLLPLQFTFQGENLEKILINWDLIGEELDNKATDSLSPTTDTSTAAISLIWLRNDDQWTFQRANWVAQDTYTLQRLDRNGEELSKKASVKSP